MVAKSIAKMYTHIHKPTDYQICEFHGLRSARSPQLPVHVSHEAGKSNIARYLQPFEGRGALYLVLAGSVFGHERR